MKQVVITLVGQDCPGIVETLSKVVYQHQGNWLASSLSKMAGQFAGIVQVSIDQEHIVELNQSLSDIENLQCMLIVDEGETPSAAQTNIAIDLVGNDKPGIVQEITSAVAHAGGSVVKMQTLCDSAPNWGGDLFKANLLVSLPSSAELDNVQENLEAIANDLVVDINVSTE